MSSASRKWTRQYSAKHNRSYWFDEATGESVWEDPTGTGTLTSAGGPLKRPASALESDEAPSSSKNSKATTQNVSNGQSISAWQRYESKSGIPYWFNPTTNESRWTDPGPEDQPEESMHLQTAAGSASAVHVIVDPRDIALSIQREYDQVALAPPNFPRYFDTIDCAKFLHRMRTDELTVTKREPAFRAVFTLKDDLPSNFTRAIQEDQILNTRLKARKPGTNEVVDLPSFWEVWRGNPSFAHEVLSSPDPQEAKWALQLKYGYKMATTFMPGYAKSIYEYFRAGVVLDPCSGWGDRMIGAALANKYVKQYVAFDPNTTLRPGYCKMMEYAGHQVVSMSATKLRFSNSFEMHALPFEVGIQSYSDEYFDMAFTSPPFFDYEMYNPLNPQYMDWLDEFYTPLFQEVCRCVKLGGFFGIHIGDTSAGVIMPFLMKRVSKISGFEHRFNLGLTGMMSNKTRTVYFYEKIKHMADALEPRNAVRRLTNPPVVVRTLSFKGIPYQLFDDGLCVGGSKQRLLGRYLETMDEDEVIYAGPETGYAQVALAFAAKLWGKRATVFLNTYRGTSPLPVLVQLAQRLGANIQFSNNARGRRLKESEQAAAEYAAQDPNNRRLLPFGLKSTKTEKLFKTFHAALLDALEENISPPPRRLWVVAGSGFLLNVLHAIWPNTEFMVVQVGKTVWPDQLEDKKHQLFVAPEGFAENAVHQPPYASVPWYDAKLWQFAMLHLKEGDAIWNVAALPHNINASGDSILQGIQSLKIPWVK